MVRKTSRRVSRKRGVEGGSKQWGLWARLCRGCHSASGIPRQAVLSGSGQSVPPAVAVTPPRAQWTHCDHCGPKSERCSLKPAEGVGEGCVQSGCGIKHTLHTTPGPQACIRREEGGGGVPEPKNLCAKKGPNQRFLFPVVNLNFSRCEIQVQGGFSLLLWLTAIPIHPCPDPCPANWARLTADLNDWHLPAPSLESYRRCFGKTAFRRG